MNKKKIKLVYIINRLITGGLEKITIDTCNNIDPDKFEVSLVVLSSDHQELNSLVNPHVKLIILPYPYREKVSLNILKSTYKSLKSIFTDLQPDVVNVTLYGARMYAVAKALRKYSPGKILVKIEHSGIYYLSPMTRSKRLNIQIEKRALRLNKSYIISVSSAICDNLKCFFGKDVCDILFIGNGIKEDVFFRDNYSVRRSDFGFSDDDILFVMVGRLDTVKDHKTLLKAWNKVQSHVAETKGKQYLLLIGEGEKRCSIEQYIKENNLSDSVRLLGNINDVPTYLSISDVGLLPSFAEGLPLSLIEKMMMRLPVIASDIDGSRDLVDQGKTGFLFPVGDADQLADHMIAMIKDEAGRRKMGEAGRQKAVESYSFSGMIQKYQQFYIQSLYSKP